MESPFACESRTHGAAATIGDVTIWANILKVRNIQEAQHMDRLTAVFEPADRVLYIEDGRVRGGLRDDAGRVAP